MKVETKYVCEICGTEYSDKNDCEACEQSHVTNLKIIRCERYKPYEKWPQYITIQIGKTGECAIYEMRYSQVHD